MKKILLISLSLFCLVNLYAEINCQKAKDDLSNIDSPMEMAKAILVAHIVSSPDDALSVGVYYNLEAGIELMKKFIEHKDFLRAMMFIESHSNLNAQAGASSMFSEVLWGARHIKEVKDRYARRISEGEDIYILKFGAFEEKEALQIVKMRKKLKVQYLYGDYDGAKKTILELKNMIPSDEAHLYIELDSYLELIKEKEKSNKGTAYRFKAGGCVLGSSRELSVGEADKEGEN